MNAPMRMALAGIAMIAAVGCSRRPIEEYRGAGLQADTLMLNDQVLVYRAMLWASFPMDDPNISILVDPLLLPRSQGLIGGDAMTEEVLSAMKAMGVSRGTCSIPVRSSAAPFVCPAEKPGYVVRFSQPYRVAADTLQVHLVAQDYATRWT